MPGEARGILSLIRQAPKAELHVHLRGAMPGHFFAKLLRKYAPTEALAGAPQRHVDLFRNCPHLLPFLSDAGDAGERAGNLFRFENFNQFLASYLFSSYFVREISDFRNLIQAVRQELAAQHVVYAEMTVSLGEYVNQGLDILELIEAMDEASQASSPLRLRWVVDLVRDLGPAATMETLRQLVGNRTESVVAITIGGAEHRFPPEQFAEHYRVARDAGLRLTVHAGEAAGPESVWGAIRSLGVERIGHGVRSIEDPRLVEYLAEKQIPLEVCLTSNIRTGVYRSYEEHPVRLLYDAGVAISISTDDPSFFNTSLAKEFEHLSTLGFSDGELLDLLKNGFRHAFLGEPEIESALNALEEHPSMLNFRSG